MVPWMPPLGTSYGWLVFGVTTDTFQECFKAWSEKFILPLSFNNCLTIFFTFAGQLNTDFLHSCTFLGTGSARRYNKVHWCTAVCTNPSSGVPSRHSVNHRVFWIKRSVNIISKFKISSHLLSFAATKLEFQFIFSPSLCLSLFPALVGTLAKKIQHSSLHTVAWMAASCFSG